jgi:hypothetical protein
VGTDSARPSMLGAGRGTIVNVVLAGERAGNVTGADFVIDGLVTTL